MKRNIALFFAVGLMLAGSLAGLSVSGRASTPAPAADASLQLLPNGMGVALIDIQSITSSDVWNTLAAGKGAHFVQSLDSNLATLGLKLTDLKTASVVFASSGMQNSVVIVTGSFDQQAVLTRLGSDPKVKLTTSKYKNHNVYTATQDGNKGAPTAFTFYDSGTVAVGSATGVQASIDVQTGDQPSLAKNDKVTGALNEMSSAAVRFVIVPASGGADAFKVSSLPLPDLSTVNLIFGTVGISSSLDLNATLRNDTADSAKVIANQLNGILAMAKGFLGGSQTGNKAAIGEAVNSIVITDSGADVKVTGTVSKDLFSKLIH